MPFCAYELSLLAGTGRELVRAGTGILSQAPVAGTRLKGNLVPASAVQIRTQAPALP